MLFALLQERLEREYNLDLVTTAPTVVYKTLTNTGEELTVNSPGDLPEATKRQNISEPYVRLEMVTPTEYVGNLMELANNRRGEFVEMKYLTGAWVQEKGFVWSANMCLQGKVIAAGVSGLLSCSAERASRGECTGLLPYTGKTAGLYDCLTVLRPRPLLALPAWLNPRHPYPIVHAPAATLAVQTRAPRWCSTSRWRRWLPQSNTTPALLTDWLHMLLRVFCAAADSRTTLVFNIPLAEVVTDYFDQLKSRSKGYASMEYKITGYR